MSKKVYIQNLIEKETKRGKTERELIGISVTKTIAQEYKNLCNKKNEKNTGSNCVD